MKHRSSRSDGILAQIKNNRIVATLIAAGTVVVALSTFSDAAKNLLSLLAGPGSGAARAELSGMAVEYTPQSFVQSAKDGNVRVVKLFLAAGMDPNAEDEEGNTALMYATTHSGNEIATALLAAKADVNKKNSGGGTALDWAAARGRLDTVRLLLDQGADAKARDEAFVSAAESAHPVVMRLLLEQGVRLNEIGPRALLSAAGSQVGTDTGTDQERNEATKFLLDHRVDVNARDKEGWTALLSAADRDRASLVQMLLDRGADVNGRCDCTGYSGGGWTALMLAAKDGHAEIMKALVAKHVDVDRKNNDGRTALALAVDRGDVDPAQILLDGGADVNAQDSERRTPLMEAVSGGKVDMTRLLLERGAHKDAKDIHGKTAMDLAAQYREAETRARLVQLLRGATPSGGL